MIHYSLDDLIIQGLPKGWNHLKSASTLPVQASRTFVYFFWTTLLIRCFSLKIEDSSFDRLFPQNLVNPQLPLH